ncbi:hypothetical protein [Pseudalkalibacillus hwajinpoensis]|uniref:DUF4025 domain-containing protein n=1 Tax=Guptibacillus hwajinpoensis TaxID=208199 RepID=A0A4U1MP18_9BACL|nr:hypothetical protein [Pseudalkalibacillus hwajinpoensis]TKD72526.1 hypothetical protein FBF83_07050 [Pseudalkalibacillus hwajinpoensis]
MDYKSKERTQANLNINDQFYKGDEHENSDEKVNDAFYSKQQKNDSAPTSYLGNDMAAVDVTGNKDRDR